MKNENPYVETLNFVYDLIHEEARIKIEPKDLVKSIKKIKYASILTSNATGENRAIECANNMLSNKFFKNKPLNTFDNVLLNVYSYDDLTLHELDIIVSKIKEKCRVDVDPVVANTIHIKAWRVIEMKMLLTK